MWWTMSTGFDVESHCGHLTLKTVKSKKFMLLIVLNAVPIIGIDADILILIWLLLMW